MASLEEISHLDWEPETTDPIVAEWLKNPQAEAIALARAAGVIVKIPKSGILETAVSVAVIPEEEATEDPA